MNLEERLKKYAEVIIKVGLNLQKDQPLLVRASVDAKTLVRKITEAAYEAGASNVMVKYKDDYIDKLYYDNASEDELKDVRPWLVDQYMDYINRGTAFLSIVDSDPYVFSKVDPNKLKIAAIANSTALKEYNNAIMSDKNSWCVVGNASADWAKVVFPELSEKEAVEKLWESILDTSRITDDPISNWTSHIEKLEEKASFLTNAQFDSLRYESSNGTKLEVGLPKNHIWAAGSSINSKGVPFTANMPTEEVFTLPHKDRVNGIVYSTKPLNYRGALIDEFYLEFKEGAVVNFDAKVGKGILEKLLETDEGAVRLGEVALVPYDSPISNSNILFYNTLYDENASCHLALGKAYPTSLSGGENMTTDELKDRGANDSLIHEDFMIGYIDTKIVGVKENGEEILIFENGNWA